MKETTPYGDLLLILSEHENFTQTAKLTRPVEELRAKSQRLLRIDPANTFVADFLATLDQLDGAGESQP
ncbi:MAG: hypothetical protein KGN34_12585 [Sphingomonadales bacterium]|nr:hypothetical protein [Sphingomonadales bacterium]